MTFTAPIAALLALADPASLAQDTDEPMVNVDQQPTTDAPAPEPTAPPAPVPLASPPPAAPLPPAEMVQEPEPARPPTLPPVRPSAGMGLEIGYAHGGHGFLTLIGPAYARNSGPTIHAGEGVFFALTGSWMPYWSESGVGLGVYARAGAKFAGVSDGAQTVSFVRVPLALGAQLLLPIRGRWFVLGRLGLMTEVLGEMTFQSGGMSGTSTDFSSTLGEFLDAGLYWAASEHSGIAAIGRYEHLDLSYVGAVSDASNLGALAGAYLRF